ncbi:hypothetical protein [Haloferula sargassicola]|uniref:Uncharacterized protein n=1 Tax=Haloferula sargassicola TaxID=490096 RepID=A0ABP9USR8_9BACT
MNSEASLEVYRRLAGCDSDSVENIARSLCGEARQRLAPGGMPAMMKPRPFEFAWQRPPRLVRRSWERVALPLFATSLAGAIAWMTMMGL